MNRTPSLAGYLNVPELLRVMLYTLAAALVTFLSTLVADAGHVFPTPLVATLVVSAITSILATAQKLAAGLKPGQVPAPAVPAAPAAEA